MSIRARVQHGSVVAAWLALAAAAPAQPSVGGVQLDPGLAADKLFSKALNDHDWKVRFEPAIWLVSPSGTVRMPGASTESVRVEHLNLDTPEVRPSGEVHLAADRWRLSFFGSQYAQETRFAAEQGFSLGDVTIDPGDIVDAEFDFTVVEVAAGYRIWEADLDRDSANQAMTVDTDIRLYAIGGLRAYDVDLDVREIGGEGGRSATDQFFVEPILGLRGEIDIARDVTIDLQMTGGGYLDSDRSVASLDIVTGFQWRPHPNVGVQVGWRQVAYWLDDGDGPDEFEYNGRMAGIQAGLVIRF
jgi:hypothetical protein